MQESPCLFGTPLALVILDLRRTNNRRFDMTKAQLLKKIALLESVNDQLSAEVSYVDHLMRLLGFSQGLLTVKATAQEIIDKGLNPNVDELGYSE